MYFNRFTQRAKTAIDLGVESAKGFGHKIVGTEHLLLGLLKEKDGIAAKVLNKLGVTEDILENKIIEIEITTTKNIKEILVSIKNAQIKDPMIKAGALKTRRIIIATLT